MAARGLVLGLVLGCASIASARGQPGPDGSEVLRRSATAIAHAKTFTYSARREPGGVLAGQLASVGGEVRIARIEGPDSLGARIWAGGEVRAPKSDAPIPFTNGYDGQVYRSLRVAERALVEGAPAAGGRSLFSDGADGVLLEPFVDPEPFHQELTRPVRLMPEGEVGGVPCRVVEVEMPESSSYPRARWWIGVEDHLPRRVEMIYRFGEDEGTQTTSVSDLATGRGLEEDRFAIDRPEGYARKTLEQTSTLLAVGTPAPDWELHDPAGTIHRLRDLKGKVVVMDFWATWCGPCRAAMPAVQKVHERFADRVVVFGMDFMDRGDAAQYMREKGYTYTLLLDADAVGKQYGVVGIPVFYVIGSDGRVAYRHKGSGADTESELTAAIEAALASGK